MGKHCSVDILGQLFTCHVRIALKSLWQASGNQINIDPVARYLFAVQYNVFVRKETFKSAQNYLKLRSKRSYINCVHTKTSKTKIHFVFPC